MSAAASTSDSTGLRSFSGDSEDAKEYKRWKVWVSNKLLTIADKVPEHARGAYVYTLLSGKALECVEHLDPSSYQKKDGEKIIFERLDQRFPQKDASDKMSEVLTEVFAVKSHEGESLKAWISRATELFDRCQRKVNVNFPEEARGWMILHRSGLSDEQKAVVLARSLGVLKREEIGRAMRSCYPDFVVGKRRAAGISLVEDSLPPEDDIAADEEFDELEQFLAEHQGKESAAAMVVEEHFIAMIDILPSSWRSLQWLREKQQKCSPTAEEQLLVSSPGFGVLDSGCGRSIIGWDTLQEFKDLWKARQMEIPEPFSEVNHFKYGNGHKEMSKQAIRVPVHLGGRVGTIKAAIVQGQAPLLISRSALKTLKATINFETNELTVFDDRVVIPLATNQAGQYTVDLLGNPEGPNSAFEEIMMTTAIDQVSAPTLDVSGSDPPAMSSIETNNEKLMAPDAGKAKYRHALPPHVLRCQTEFLYTPQEECLVLESLPKHHLRQLEAIVRETLAVQPHDKSQQSHDHGKTLLVAEVFSPPRFSPVVEQMGFASRSYDLLNGYDFRRAADRKQEAASCAACPSCPEQKCQEVLMAKADLGEKTDEEKLIEENPTSGSDLKTASSYGPVRSRSRVAMKSGPAALFRPRPMLQDDFVDLMTEVVPRLITEHIDKSSAVNWEPDPDSMQDVSSGPSSGSGLKRSADSQVATEEPPAVRPKTDDTQDSKMAWTSDDAAKLQELLQKAAANGVHPLAALEKTGRHFQDDGFELVTTGGMSDTDGSMGYYVKEMMPVPLPSSSLDPAPTYLPAGVKSLTQWSQSIIGFGKFKGKGMSYADLINAGTEETKGYIKWCKSRQSSAGGELADLANFLVQHEAEQCKSGISLGEVIAGTSTRRVFKS
ncbi:unnamed protein product [Durusdinium trenchii]|uniref:Uncharacterized protein n=1 Tax=Durusdinium trenchii TaxID=1381693 RepID=A0ABP0NYM7_9DINO